ncbi:nuclear hormone receptor family member nhr-8-like [Littorina saxatilis]|uniref:Nuclear receptor domain-containing protein n=1 Tax=Littorina saxatilis TaxID=31220 RepID=A0AAN9GJR9_9CAEN
MSRKAGQKNDNQHGPAQVEAMDLQHNSHRQQHYQQQQQQVSRGSSAEPELSMETSSGHQQHYDSRQSVSSDPDTSGSEQHPMHHNQQHQHLSNPGQSSGNAHGRGGENVQIANHWVDSSENKLDLQSLGLGIGDSGMPILTKLEPVDFKGDLITRLKQEYVGGGGIKEGHLRELLMRSGAKDFADDSASKALLQLSGQSMPDIKALGAQLLAASNGASEHSLGQAGMAAFQSMGGSVEPGGISMQMGPDGTLRPKKIRHKKRVNGKKICLVCGDKALAHNFDVITCESCKAFFRRNALKSQNLQRCMFQNSCTIDKNTRRFCPSCRLKKCFDIGMKAELMLDDEERRLRQEKKAQRQKQPGPGTATEEGGEGQVGSSGIKNVDMDGIAFSPDSGVSTPQGNSFSPTDAIGPHGSSSATSSLQPSPLPSFHTLRDPLAQSPSASGRSSPFSPGGSSSYGVSPGVGLLQPSTAEHSPFSTLLNQLSTSSQSPVATTSLSPVPPAGHQQHQQQQHSAPPYPQNKSPRSVYTESSLAQQQKRHQLYQEEDDGEETIEETTGEEEEQAGFQPQDEAGAYPLLPGPGARIFKHVPRDQLPSDPFMYWIVSGEERLVLANLTIAYQEVLLSLPERGLCRNVPISDNYFIHDFLNEIDDAMYKIVQFSKHIPDFRLVRKEDQIAMLKSSAMQTLGIACCAAYVHERDCWLSLRGDLTSSHLRKLTNDDPYIQIGVEYCRSVKSLVKNDFTIYALIHCMILFDPRDAKIVDRQIINQTRDKYVIMLKHYLESQYSYLYADEYFVAIQERVREMCHLALSGNALFRRYSSAFQPLITEMLSSG